MPTNCPFDYPERARATSLATYLEPEPAGPRLARIPRQSLPRAPHRHRRFPGRRSTSACSARSAIVVRMEPGVQTPEETLDAAPAPAATRRGCWCRCCAISASPARFVSGYLIQLKPDSWRSTGPPAPSSDFTDLHAWAEVYLPGAGWIGLDPTSGLLDRRRPHPARRDAALPLRRADHRHASSRPRSSSTSR